MNYALMIEDELMIKINITALVLHTLYLIFYIIYTEDLWNEVIKPLLVGIGFTGIMLNYARYEDAESVKWRYAMIITCLMLILLALPLLDVVRLWLK